MQRQISVVKDMVSSRLAIMSEIIFAVAAIVALFQVGSLLFDREPPGIGVDSRLSETIPQQTNASEIGSLFSREFKPTDQNVAPPLANETIRLFGTRPRENGLGRAILSVDGGQQKVIKTGDLIDNGGTLVSVHSDRVEVSHNGEIRSVYLRGSETHDKRRMLLQEQTMSKQSLASAKPKAPVKSVSPKKSNSSLFKSPSFKAVERKKQQQRISGANPDLFSKNMNIIKALGIQPSAKGLIVGPKAYQNLLERAGLNKGDLITVINGRPANDRRALPEMYNLFKNGETIILSVQSRGQEKQVSVSSYMARIAQMGR